jgi:hypothetical protein
MSVSIGKPPHSKYILANVSEDKYRKYAIAYAASKKLGIRGIYAFLTGNGLYILVKESSRGVVYYYGKRRMASIVLGVASYVSAPAVSVLTNSTRIIRSCQVVYTGIGYVAEALEDSSQVPFLPPDFLLFGQLIPANIGGRFSNSWGNISNLISDSIGDS